jgi:hypothetical protein
MSLPTPVLACVHPSLLVMKKSAVLAHGRGLQTASTTTMNRLQPRPTHARERKEIRHPKKTAFPPFQKRVAATKKNVTKRLERGRDKS